MSTTYWAGSRAERARSICALLVGQGAVCYRCRKPIVAGQPWHADHIIPRGLGGSDDAGNLHPSHARCNEQEGGRRGALITQEIRRAKRAAPAAAPATERTRGIRGL